MGFSWAHALPNGADSAATAGSALKRHARRAARRLAEMA